MFYRRVLKPLFFLLHPDVAHDLMLFAGDIAGRIAPARWVLALVWGYRGPDISKVVDGVRYERPVLLSAGFDCNGRLTRTLSYISFGGEEVGSITAYPCVGNHPPYMARLVRNRSVIINKGLRNWGVDAVLAQLRRRGASPGFVVGVSVAQTNGKEVSNLEAGLDDYAATFKKLNEVGAGDYYTINISCPNSFGGETFATPVNLSKLVARLQQVPCNKPVYFKMPINLAWDEFDALLQIIAASPYHGVVIGNLNKNYAALDYPEDAPKTFGGGLSGKPCFAPSNELILKTRKAYGKRFTIIGTGGIFSGEDAMQKFEAGADLVQLITGMVFEGPGLIKRICFAYAQGRAGAAF